MVRIWSVNIVASGRETRVRGNHRTEATEGESAWWLKFVRWTSWPQARTRARGNHRTEVTEGTEGESTLWLKSLGGHLGFRARSRARGIHRTEVTEATEGESALWFEIARWTSWLQGGKHGHGEFIAQRSQRPQRGNQLCGLKLLGGHLGFRAGSTGTGNSSHGGYGGHRGGISFVV